MLEGTFSEAERYGEEAIRWPGPSGAGARDTEAHALTHRGDLGWGDDPVGARAAPSGRTISTELGQLDEYFRATANLTTVLDLLGRRAEAVDIAYEIAEAARSGSRRSTATSWAATPPTLPARALERGRDLACALEWAPGGVN
jgi:hypothetical protein